MEIVRLLVLLLIFSLCVEVSASEKYVQINGATLHYRESGSGQALILLHDSLLSSGSWEFLSPEVSKGFRVFEIDTRGHGKSSNPDGLYSFPLLTDDVAGFIWQLNLENPVILGYGNGGMTALLLAIKHQGLASAVIIAGVTRGQGRSKRYFDALKNNFLSSSTLSISDTDLDRLAIEKPEMISDLKRRHSVSRVEYDWRKYLKSIWPMWTNPVEIFDSDLKSIDLPVLLILGDRDEYYSVDEINDLYRLIPDAQLSIAASSDHSFYSENHALFNSIVLSFLERLSIKKDK